MGKKIDRFVLTIAFAGGIYLLLRRKIASDILCIALSVLICMLFTKLIRKIITGANKSAYLQKKRIRKISSGTIMQLACGDEAEAREKLSGMLNKIYHENCNMELIQYPPSACLEQQKIFECWKKHCGTDRLVICATCKCEQQARILASSMKNPRIALIDAEAMRNMIAECPEEMLAEESHQRCSMKTRFIKLSALIFKRKNAPRCLLFAMSMLGIYLLNGRTSYLMCSMGLFFCTLVSLHRRSRPAKLF